MKSDEDISVDVIENAVLWLFFVIGVLTFGIVGAVIIFL